MSTVSQEASRVVPNTTTVPSAVAVALFAWLATRAVAKYGFGYQEKDAD